jgi:hypothetical protein
MPVPWGLRAEPRKSGNSPLAQQAALQESQELLALLAAERVLLA